MEILAAFLGFIISLPIAVRVFQKHMRAFDSVWVLPAKQRAEKIAELRALTPAIGHVLAILAILLTVGVALFWEGMGFK